ncbi:MAG: heparinase II/III family protein [Planctomycetota bacterium]|nr:heparinase II/III family protein [Planctomycetota bacterium]
MGKKLRQIVDDGMARIARPDPFPEPPDAAAPIAWTELARRRPRLLTTKAELDALRARLTAPVEAEMLARLRRQTDKYLEAWTPPEPGAPILERGGSVPQPFAALSFLLTGDERYLEAARRWTLALARSGHTWVQGGDLGFSHALSGVSIAYDLLHEHWAEAERAEIREFIRVFGGRYFSLGAVPTCYWGAILLQNHTQVAWTSFGLMGLAFHDELEPAKLWAEWAHRTYRVISWLQPHDGTNLEGCSYGGYGAERRMLYYEAARRCLGENLYAHGEREAAQWFLHQLLPDFKAGHNAFNWGDNPRRYDVHGPVHTLLGIARALKEPLAQGLGLELWRRKVGFESALSFTDLLNYAPEVPAADFKAQPTSRHFADWDLICARGGWESDATALSFRSGPFQGHRLMTWNSGDLGGAHIHADEGALMLYSRRQWLLTDPGYEALKRTDHHNTVLADGLGQVGEGTKWYDVNRVLHYAGWAEVRSFADDGRAAGWVGDLARHYLHTAQLTRFHRHVLYLRPDLLVLLDDLAAAEPRIFSQLWHSETPFAAQPGGGWGFTAGLAALGVWPGNLPEQPAPTAVSRGVELPDLSTPGRHEELRFESPRVPAWRFVTVFALGDAARGVPAAEVFIKGSEVTAITAGPGKITARFDLEKLTAPALI